MDPHPEYSIFLILEELDTKHNTMSYQDLCKTLCSRFDLVHLTKLRSLLFYTACLDPAFPATLFKDKIRCSIEDPQSNKLMVAADIVTMFNLIQMIGSLAKEEFHIIHRVKKHMNKSVDLCSLDNNAHKFQQHDRGSSREHMDHPRDGNYHHVHHNHLPQEHLVAHSAPPCSKSSECNSCQQFIPTLKPNLHLGVSKDLKFRAASLDKLPRYSSRSRSSSPCEMQTTYFPMDIDSESTSEQESLQHVGHQGHFSVPSSIQKRNIFKEEFHNLVAFSPQVIYTECKQGSKAPDSYHVRDLQKPPTFFNRSFELPYTNPYSEPTLNSQFQEKWKVKHESLDDLQVSTYFGPTTVSECVSNKKYSNKAVNQLSWPVKSLSLNTDELPPHLDRSFVNSKPLKENHHRTIISSDNKQHFQSPNYKKVASPTEFVKKKNGITTMDVALMASGPVGLDRKETVKRFRDKDLNSLSFHLGDSGASVGTQTEQAKQKKEGIRKDYITKYADKERNTFQHSEEDSEIISDDISDIFRFLDDMSVCDSLGVVQSSCYNNNSSLSQVTLNAGDSSSECNNVKLARSKLDRLFHKLENTDGELRSSVCKLVMRISDIEKKLESLSEVRREISEVLSKLNKLDEKIQEPEATGRLTDALSASRSNATPNKPHPHSRTLFDTPLSPHVFKCHTTGHNVKVDNGPMQEWCYSDGSNSDSLRIKALKKSIFTRRSSGLLNDEKSATESKVASITDSLQNWRIMSYSCHPEEDERDTKDRHCKVKEAELERQYELHRSLRPTEQSYLNKQVFLPHPLPASGKGHVTCSPFCADLRLTNLLDGKRGQSSWTTEKNKRNSGVKGKTLTHLDLQTQESPNPNNLEFWMEDIYTPGYDSVLKKKEADFRRTKSLKIGALIAAATCTVILVIVVPICTMKS